MPIYEYECEPCRVVYEVRQAMRDSPLETCPRCQGVVTRVMSAPNVNRQNLSSPTAARYAKLSTRDEITKEREMQKGFERIWLPPPVKHSPWED
jgi:putative FmdB family regulatory protein